VKSSEQGGMARRSSASRNGPFGLCQAESFGNSFLARIIHERFYYNRRSAATTSLRPVGSPLGPSPYYTSMHRVLNAPRAGLATRLSDFATNRHEQCGLDSASFPADSNRGDFLTGCGKTIVARWEFNGLPI
jgi:hypothetical protein